MISAAKVEPLPAGAPAFSPTGGTFAEPQLVTLTSSTPGAVIHYTTDGSAPSTASPLYSGPITASGTTTISAIAVAPGTLASPVATSTYVVTPPPPATPRVTVTTARLELGDKVYFDTGKATIKPVSYSLLDEVATALKGHADVKKIEIAGHTDNTGKAAFNRRLSQQRADAVRAYLVGKGVEPARLETKGFGQEKPLAPNTTAQGREKNRRVEFNIVD